MHDLYIELKQTLNPKLSFARNYKLCYKIETRNTTIARNIITVNIFKAIEQKCWYIFI